MRGIHWQSVTNAKMVSMSWICLVNYCLTWSKKHMRNIINLLIPGKFGCKVELVILSWIDVWSIFSEIAIRQMPQDLTEDCTTMVLNNGLVPLGIKHVTWQNVYPALCCPTVSLGYNELIVGHNTWYIQFTAKHEILYVKFHWQIDAFLW